MINFKALYENSPSAILILKDEKFIDCNSAAVDLLEADTSVSLLKSTPSTLLASQKTPNGISNKALWKKILAEFRIEGKKQFNLYCRTLKGKEFWAELDFRWLEENIKDPISAIYIKDNSELKESESNFHLFVESSPDIILRFDKNHNYLFANDRTLESSGKPGSYYTGRNIYDHGFPKRIVNFWDKSLNEVFITGKEKRVEFLFLNDVWFDWYMVPEKDKVEGVKSVICFVRNINQQKKTEEKLRLKQEQLRFALEFAKLAYWEILLPEGKFWVEEPHANIYGIPFPGKPFLMAVKDLFLEYVIPEDLPHLEKVYYSLYHGKTDKASVQFRIDRNGEIKLLLASAILVRDKEAKGKMIYGVTQDITALKEREEELLLKQTQLRYALDFAQLAYWDTELPESVILFDSSLMKMFGIPDKGEPVKMTLEEFFVRFLVEEDQPKVRKVWYDLAQGKVDKASVEYRILKNGEERILTSGGVLIKDEKRKKHRVYGITQDITELKRNEMELKMYRDKLEDLVEKRTSDLKESQEYFKVAMEMANLWRWEYDPESGNYTADETCAKIVGLEEIKDRVKDGRVVFSQAEWLNYVHPDDRKMFLEGVKESEKVREGGILPEAIYRLLDVKGNVRYCFIHRRAIYDPVTGKLIKRYGVAQDITRIQRAEAEKERLYRIVESTSDVIAIVGKDKTLIYLNKAGLDFFGLSSESNLSKWKFSFQHRGSTLDFIKKESFTEATQNGVWSGENILINKYGERVPISQVVIAHLTIGGKLECFSTIIRDMTAQKRVEEELRFKNNELDTFLYKTYHDLRGPVATLKGLNRLAQREFHRKKVLDFFLMYNQEVKKLYEIVQALIDLSKIKEKVVKKHPIDFSLLVSSCIDGLKKTPGFEEINFKKEIMLLKTFKSDESLLRIIFINLIKNSIQYRKLNINSYIKVEVYRRMDRLIIEVSDNGQGIPTELKEKVFDMFFRANEFSTGSGLGLYLVRNAVDSLGGTIKLQSEKEKGASFRVSLPFIT
ncbi:PAS domain S-box protein [Xanthovirga aplysinae]|uniref:PAS domain-containing sensor histidine kinase n=1 Tax=Xanthovirga aplysinae TaxID=2529853 RepID=UPI0012BC6814|nr:PAS domain S-box protein [Xanthovirga aplysinae]MTI30601.1 PAS domain S-box protein [Xanthovirga aplysinae]